MTKKLLLTGSSGFVGHNILAFFLDNTVLEIICPIREHNRYTRWIQQQYPTGRLKFTDRYQSDVDYIIHSAAAAQLTDIQKDPMVAVENNVTLTANLIDFARQNCKNLQRFIYISTGDVYGPNSKSTSWEETNLTNCISAYAATKLAGENIVQGWANAYHIPSFILRVQNIYGPRSLSNKFLLLLYSSLRQRRVITLHSNTQGTTPLRSWLHVNDVSRACNFLLDFKSEKFCEIFNLGGGDEYTLLECAQIMAEIMKADLRYQIVAGDLPGHGLRNTLCKKKIEGAGFDVKYNFKTGIEELIRWADQHPDWINQ